MQQWWWTLVPVVLTGVGYMLRRWVERRKRTEGLKRKLQALALHRGMRRSGLTMHELEVIERRAAE